MYEDKQGPQVFGMVLHGALLSDTQSGAREQSTEFITEEYKFRFRTTSFVLDEESAVRNVSDNDDVKLEMTIL